MIISKKCTETANRRAADDEIQMNTEVIYRPQRLKTKRNRSRSRARGHCRK